MMWTLLFTFPFMLVVGTILLYSKGLPLILAFGTSLGIAALALVGGWKDGKAKDEDDHGS